MPTSRDDELVTIRHRHLVARTRRVTRARAAELAKVWDVVEDDEATAPAPRKVLVLAASKAEADAWRREQPNVRAKDVLYAAGADAVAGVSPADVDVVELPGFAGREDADAIRAALAGTDSSAAAVEGTPDQA